jgi:PknH-like extracellular domain
MRGVRRYGWLIGIAAVLSGCTTMTAGAALPADDLGHSPALVPVAALDGLLLPPEQLSALLNTGPLVMKNAQSKMAFRKTTAEDCAATFRAFWGPVYQGSGFVAVRSQYLTDPDGTQYKVWQGVIAFPLALDAQAFYRKQAAGWHTCENRRIEERFVDEAPSPDDWFKMGAASDRDGMLSMVHTEEDTDTGWACERALTIRNNVAVDVEACTEHRTDQGEVVATAIAAKVPVK